MTGRNCKENCKLCSGAGGSWCRAVVLLQRSGRTGFARPDSRACRVCSCTHWRAKLFDITFDERRDESLTRGMNCIGKEDHFIEYQTEEQDLQFLQCSNAMQCRRRPVWGVASEPGLGTGRARAWGRLSPGLGPARLNSGRNNSGSSNQFCWAVDWPTRFDLDEQVHHQAGR